MRHPTATVEPYPVPLAVNAPMGLISGTSRENWVPRKYK